LDAGEPDSKSIMLVAAGDTGGADDGCPPRRSSNAAAAAAADAATPDKAPSEKMKQQQSSHKAWDIHIRNDECLLKAGNHSCGLLQNNINVKYNSEEFLSPLLHAAPQPHHDVHYWKQQPLSEPPRQRQAAQRLRPLSAVGLGLQLAQHHAASPQLLLDGFGHARPRLELACDP
jgi:hypothetical protein